MFLQIVKECLSVPSDSFPVVDGELLASCAFRCTYVEQPWSFSLIIKNDLVQDNWQLCELELGDI